MKTLTRTIMMIVTFATIGLIGALYTTTSAMAESNATASNNDTDVNSTWSTWSLSQPVWSHHNDVNYNGIVFALTILLFLGIGMTMILV